MKKINKPLLNVGVVAIFIFLSGCGFIPTAPISVILPDGSDGFSISCNKKQGIVINENWAHCYKMAGKSCPQGYDVIDKRQREMPEAFTYEPRFMVIKCKKS